MEKEVKTPPKKLDADFFRQVFMREMIALDKQQYERHKAVVRAAKNKHYKKVSNDPEQYKTYLEKQRKIQKAYRDRQKAKKQAAQAPKIVIDEQPANV